jgi:hypothetical protein
MMSKEQIQTWINALKIDMKELAKDGHGRDWIAYEEINHEIEILEAVLK